jgi:hypothetical protein
VYILLYLKKGSLAFFGVDQQSSESFEELAKAKVLSSPEFLCQRSLSDF